MLPLGVGGAFYINLDHRTDRRAEFEAEAATMGLACERFSAIRGNPGLVGCGYSHLAVLKLARDRGYESVLIFEDDFQFLVDKTSFWSLMNEVQKEAASYDVIMLGYNIQHSEPYSDHLLKIMEAQTASAYFVHSRMYNHLIALYEMAIPELQREYKHWIYANDQIWKRLQPSSDWFATKIRVGKQRASYSDNAESWTDYNV
jgi:hypothetical protein